MANISEQFLVNLSQSLGVSYDLKKNVLGSSTNPNSALFNISQISSLLLYGKPNFGVWDDANSFASLTFDTVLNSFKFSTGKVYYNQNLIVMPSQIISATSSSDQAGTKFFKFYIDYNDFLLSSTVFSCNITVVDTNVITVDQLPSIIYLNNFKTVSINNYLFNVSSIDSTAKTISLMQDATNYAFVGSTLILVFQPLIKFISTFAITGTPPNLSIPTSGIDFAEATVDISGTTTLSYSCPLGVTPTFTAFSTYTSPADLFPTQSSYNAFLKTTLNAVKAYNNLQSYDLETNLLSGFINYTSGISSSAQTFDTYWNLQPYTPTQLFQYGINFAGLQKVDFDKRFKDFWYDYKNTDLTRTYAVFRGDIYGGNAVVGQVAGRYPGSVTIQNFVDFSNKATNYNGTFSYGISAVSPLGEYSPVFATSGQFYFNKKVNNYISWTTTTSVPNLLFFHVYKNTQTTNGFEQQRLTSTSSLTGYTLNDTILSKTSNTEGISTSVFAFKIKSSDSTSGVIGGLYFNANIIDNTPLTGISSYIISNGGSNYVSPRAIISGNGVGASVLLYTNVYGSISSAQIIAFGSGYTETPTITVIDNNTTNGSGAVIYPVLSSLSCGLYTGNSSRPLGLELASFEPITIASINTSYPMNMPLSGRNFIGLDTNFDYWAVFNMSTPYALTSNQQLKFFKSSSYSGTFGFSTNGTDWQATTTQSQVAKLGFVDQNSSGTVTSSRGVYLTNDQAARPTRLQIFIPNMNLSNLLFDDIGINAVSNSSLQTSAPIQNSMTVYVTAYNTQTGIKSTLSANIPQGTSRGSYIPLGGSSDLFDQVEDVVVEPNISLGVNYIPNTRLINWTIYDLFSVDSST